MFKPKHFNPPGRSGGIAPWKVVAAVVVLIVLVYAAYSLLQPGVTNISSTTSMSIQQNQTVTVSVYGGSPIAIRLQKTSSSSAGFYVTRLPVLYGPIVSVFLNSNGGANVSSNGTRIADMNMKLDSSDAGSARIDITPLPTALAIRPSPNIQILTPVNFYSQQPGANSVLTATTTIGTGPSSTSTSTVATTTVVLSSGAQLMQQALSLMNGTTVGILMKHYKALYIADAGCSESTYNTTYMNNYYTQPPAYASYANASLYTPRDLEINETLLPAKNTVRINYTTLSPSPLSTGPALTVIVNTSALSYLKSISYVGVFGGLNYTVLNASYTFQKGIGNSCGAWIPPK